MGKGEPVVKPEELVRIEGFNPGCSRCLIVFWNTPLQYAKNILENVVVDSKPKIPSHGGLKGELKGETICVYRLPIGAPASVLALEMLIAAGVKYFLVYGGGGAVHPSVRIYDVVIPTWGIREEGTSYHYLPPNITPKPSEKLVKILVEELKNTVEELGVRLHVGGVWSTDAVFRETRDKVEEYASRNILVVDMESTALMAVAMYRKVELGITLIVMDELHGEKWRIYEWEKMRNVEERIVETLLGILAKIT